MQKDTTEKLLIDGESNKAINSDLNGEEDASNEKLNRENYWKIALEEDIWILNYFVDMKH